MKRTLKTLILIFVFIGCQNKTNNNKPENLSSAKQEFELNKALIDRFHRDDRLRPDNPDFEFYRVANFSFDLNNNQKVDSIILKRLRGWENDPGDFQQILIKLDNGLEWTETNFTGWVRFDNNYSIPNSVKELNQINTDLLLVTDFEKTKVVGLFGWVYESKPGLMTFIDFSTKQPRIMINKNLDLIGINQNKIITEDSNDKCWIENINNKIIMTCE